MSERCESKSPIYKLDEGPRQCRKPEGHSGMHCARISDGRYVEPQWDYDVQWDDAPAPPVSSSARSETT